jgi:hypothetical protein
MFKSLSCPGATSTNLHALVFMWSIRCLQISVGSDSERDSCLVELLASVLVCLFVFFVFFFFIIQALLMEVV